MYSSVHLTAALLVSALMSLSVAQHDETLTPGAQGAGVVEAVSSRLEASCAFPEDKLFTRRLAYVESFDGNHPDAYRTGYDGGIWKVDESKFTLTQTTTVRNYLSSTILAIKQAFGIDWATVKWVDLRKPLYSAIGARLYIQYNARSVTTGIPRAIADQANYWVLYYRADDSRDRYISEAEKLEKGCTSSNGADIVFILDESGSVGSTNFGKVKSFVKDFVRSFNVGLGSHQTRIAVTTYSSSISRKFDLNDFTTQASLISAIDRIGYSAGGTNTHLALDDLAVSFTAARGARSKEAGHPRVGIVVTDGESNSPSLTATSARKVHAADITVFSVGVGSSLNMTELQIIASNPPCLHLMLLSNFQEFDSLKQGIEKRTCDAPVVVNPGENITVTPPDDGQNCKIKVPNAGSTVKVRASWGTVNFYVAVTTYPSNDYFEYRVVARPGRLGVIYLAKPRTNETLGIYFCNIKGDNSSSNASIGVQPGDSDKCRDITCQNGGECVQTDTDAWCECPQQYTGQNCESDVNPCVSDNPCLNGATCSPIPTGVLCTCVPGFIGPNCQLNKDECRSNPCTNGGTCTDLLNGYQCTCPPGFTGNNCQNDVNPCVSDNPCLNGATCSPIPTGVLCTCVPGFIGPNCQLNKDECRSNPCTNGGTCTDLLNGYQCSCPPGFGGTNCQIIFDPCSSMPCIFGTCSSAAESYSCSCDVGYTGENCDTVVTTPAPGGYDCQQNNPCLDPNNINNGRFYFPHHDPNKFVQCSEWGQCFVMSCGSGTVWDSTANTCVVGGGASTSTTTTSGSGSTYDCASNNPCTQENIDGGRFYFANADPTKFVQCSEFGQCFVLSCGSGTVWDSTAYTCVTGDGGSGTGGTYNCATNNPCTPEKTSGGQFYFPHDNRSKFVQCSEWGQCYEVSCGSGLVWDPVKYACDWP